MHLIGLTVKIILSMKIFANIIILFVKLYKLIISPYLISNCRYLPTCSEYFIDSLKINGAIKGSYLGIKRILSCHPIKFLGGGNGLDPVPNLKKIKTNGK